MSMRIDNRFKYFKDINESLKQKYQTTEDFPYSEMAEAQCIPIELCRSG